MGLCRSARCPFPDAAKQLEVVDLIQELRIDRCKARVQELVLPLLSNVPPAVHRNALTTFLGGFADLTLTGAPWPGSSASLTSLALSRVTMKPPF